MSYEFIRLKIKIAIVHQDFQKYDRTVKPPTTYMMSFSNPKMKQTKQKAKAPIIAYEEENDAGDETLAIQNLIIQFQGLKLNLFIFMLAFFFLVAIFFTFFKQLV